jgi:simple sugar transport system substrate-binding protein
MKLTRLKTAALAAGIATMMTSTALAADVKATMIIYLDPSVQFFNPVVKGAKDAAAQFGVDLDV